MNLLQFYTSFCFEIEKWTALDPVSVSTLESASNMFVKFHTYNLKQNKRSLWIFVHSSYQYFELIIQHAEHWGKITSHECQLNVKIALNKFMFVLNRTNSCSNVILGLAKFFFDQLIIQYEEYDFIQEFLKVYVGCLNNVPKRILDQLGYIHKNLHLLANVLRETHEINMQAVIVAMLLKIPYNSETSQLEIIFPEVRTLVETVVDDDYQKIRLVLEELNKNSTMIFSIHCKDLILDFQPVLEFEGALLNSGVWLDVDLVSKTLSFFCSPTILSEYRSDVKFGLTTNWEFVSFKAEDCLKTTFTCSYDEITETEILEIHTWIKISKINLFRRLTDDKILHFVFKISNYSKKYEIFLIVILPQLFPDFVPENFAYNFPYTVARPSSEQIAFENSSGNYILKVLGYSNSPEVEHPHFTQKNESNTKENMIIGFNPLPEESKDENQKFAQTMRPSMCAFDTQELEIKEEPCSTSTKKTPTAKGDCENQSSFGDLHSLERIFGNENDENVESKSGVQEKKQKNVGKLDDKSLNTWHEKEIKEEPSSPSTEKTPAAKSGWTFWNELYAATKCGLQEHNYQVRDPKINSNVNPASKSELQKYNYLLRDPRILSGKVNAASKSRLQEYSNKVNGGELDDKSQNILCNKKVAVVSALSAPQSSSTPCMVPVATPSNESKRASTATQSSAKRLKENEGASNVKKINIISNILIKEADKIILQPKPSNGEFNDVENLSQCYCCMLDNKENCVLLDLISKHFKTPDSK